MKRLVIDAIEVDGDAQARAEICEATVQEYADAMADGAEFPPLVVFFDGAKHWLADGFHRWRAARRADLEQVACDVRAGSKRDAILHAVGANSSHGLKRSNADKRRAVAILLRDDEWRKKSDRWIAGKCGVSPNFASTMRNQLSSDDTSNGATPESREGQDGKSYPAKGNGGKGKGKPKAAPKPALADDAEPDGDELRGEPVPVVEGMTPMQINDAIGFDAEGVDECDEAEASRAKKKKAAPPKPLSELGAVANSLEAQIELLIRDIEREEVEPHRRLAYQDAAKRLRLVKQVLGEIKHAI